MTQITLLDSRLGTARAHATGVHSAGIRAVHWLSAGAVGLAFALAVGRDLLDLPGLDRQILGVHRSVGVLVLGLSALRPVVRLTGRMVPADTDGLLKLAASAGHLALYVLLFAVPLLGLTLTNARGQAVSVFGLFDLPLLTGRDRDLADMLEDWHGFLAWSLLALIAAHVAAALWHAFARRDRVIHAMLGLRAPLGGRDQ
ncbi:cytochrome b/b6 domain-containing protein [Alsobacter sp. SYSU M60028]|uniref:Cytochrome b/b6 domain-containing protein n=1 Tax=Alsobacter ponti TaxID=2962936 RepID=A0ABT1LDW2_9HYPH|nr:cytochrome b/b6 domain-containing protein [Alsobacter ponti]MCP8939690.1 cytochrome b/b6 domain-containing protein [Alsobacter ponti]